jgi:four helix bundle protein
MSDRPQVTLHGEDTSIPKTHAMNVENLEIYQLARSVSERVWTIVLDWNTFERDTIGKQMVRAADSVSANLSEGYGRFHFAENRQHCYYARGSLFELRDWLSKSYTRKLLSQDVFDGLMSDLDTLGRRLNAYIKSIGRVNKATSSDCQPSTSNPQ